MSHAMRDALKGRRMKGLDIHIILGGDKPGMSLEDEDKESDLAPNVKEEAPALGTPEGTVDNVPPVDGEDGAMNPEDPHAAIAKALGGEDEGHLGAPGGLDHKVKLAMLAKKAKGKMK